MVEKEVDMKVRSDPTERKGDNSFSELNPN